MVVLARHISGDQAEESCRKNFMSVDMGQVINLLSSVCISGRKLSRNPLKAAFV